MKTFTTLEKEGKEGYKGRKLQHMNVLLLFCIHIFRISNSWLCLQKPVGKSLTCFRCLVSDSVGKGGLLLTTLRSEKKGMKLVLTSSSLCFLSHFLLSQHFLKLQKNHSFEYNINLQRICFLLPWYFEKHAGCYSLLCRILFSLKQYLVGKMSMPCISSSEPAFLKT